MNEDQTIRSRQQRDLLAQTGPGTPGGNLLRRYWQPVVLARDFTKDSAPRPIRILGEDLVLFRGQDGRPALLGLKCAHRCADLSYGRVEDGGLRCVYHGWLYDAEGRCLEQPGEPGGGKQRDRIRQLAYPCIERAGAIWAYMGPGAPPLFPLYPALSVPDDYRYTVAWFSSCNYLQGNEGNIDPIHTSYLHFFDPAQAEEGLSLLKRSAGIYQVDRAPKLGMQDTRYGLRLFAERQLPDQSRKLLRVTNFVMPNACAIGGAEAALGRGGASMFWHVPIDDLHHWRFEFTFHSKAMLPKAEMDRAYSSEKLPGDLPRRHAGNRYLQDRAAQQWSYLGMGSNFASHDLFVTESQGAMHDHAMEHLASSDVAIVRSRRMLAEAIEEVAKGQDPRGVIRDEAENQFDDLLVLTEEVEKELDNAAVCDRFSRMNIYEPDPSIVSRPAA